MKIHLQGLNEGEIVEFEFLNNGVMTVTLRGLKIQGVSGIQNEISVGAKETQLFRQFISDPPRKERL